MIEKEGQKAEKLNESRKLKGTKSWTPARIEGISYLIDHDTLAIKSDFELQTLSSSLVGAGRLRSKYILNHFIPSTFAPESFGDEMEELSKRFKINQDENKIVLLTAVKMQNQAIIERALGNLNFFVAVTAGVRNSCSPLDPPENLYKETVYEPGSDELAKLGTINIIVIVDGVLPEHVLTNLFIIITEAKCCALNKLNIQTPHKNTATGTNTDAITVAHTNRGIKVNWTGYATEFGYVVGQLVMDGIEKSLELRRQ